MKHPFPHSSIVLRFKPILAFVISLCALTANAYDFEVGGLCYNRNDDGKSVTVTYERTSSPRYSSLSGTLTIPSSVSYGGTTYSVTSIGESAFYKCTGLTGVSIPNSVTEIGSEAFRGCTGLTGVSIPNSVTEIGLNAFYGTAWYNNQPNGLVYAGLVAYTYKGTMPSGTAISLKAGTKGIADWAFYFRSGLTSVDIPNSVIKIGDYAFTNCHGLTSIVVENGNTKYDSRNNCNAIIETATNALIAGCKNTVIPNSVTTISDYAFRGCSGLTSVTIPNSVTTIGSEAFYFCYRLTSVTIPNSVTTIGSEAFRGCSGLTSITIPNSVTEIGYKAFENCSGLTSIYAYLDPNNIKLGSYAFRDVPTTSCVLYVPTLYLDDYKSADQWKEFTHIEPTLGNPDVSGDGVVGIEDMNIVINHILGNEDSYNTDINDDHTTDLSDLNLIINAILNK